MAHAKWVVVVEQILQGEESWTHLWLPGTGNGETSSCPRALCPPVPV